MAIPQYAMPNYGSYLEKTSVANTTRSANVQINASNQKYTNKGTDRMRQQADMIPDYNWWTAIAKAGIKATAQWFDSMTERKSLEAQSNSYMYDFQLSMMNANLVDAQKQLAELDIRSACNEVYNQYYNGEIQAFEQGLQDAQATAAQQAQSASSGVRMNSGSKAEINQSNKLSSEINQYIIQRNTDSNASNARQQMYTSMRQLSDLDLQKANYMAQGYIAMGNYKAMQIQAKSIKPLEQANFAFGESIANSAMNMYGRKM